LKVPVVLVHISVEWVGNLDASKFRCSTFVLASTHEAKILPHSTAFLRLIVYVRPLAPRRCSLRQKYQNKSCSSGGSRSSIRRGQIEAGCLFSPFLFLKKLKVFTLFYYTVYVPFALLSFFLLSPLLFSHFPCFLFLPFTSSLLSSFSSAQGRGNSPLCPPPWIRH